jgi:hypothetical protein
MRPFAIIIIALVVVALGLACGGGHACDSMGGGCADAHTGWACSPVVDHGGGIDGYEYSAETCRDAKGALAYCVTVSIGVGGTVGPPSGDDAVNTHLCSLTATPSPVCAGAPPQETLDCQQSYVCDDNQVVYCENGYPTTLQSWQVPVCATGLPCSG